MSGPLQSLSTRVIDQMANIAILGCATKEHYSVSNIMTQREKVMCTVIIADSASDAAGFIDFNALQIKTLMAKKMQTTHVDLLKHELLISMLS